MRTKSEARRQAILDAAAQVFQRAGYERTSMDDIRAEVGCSKATLYSYFASKEELFYEVVTEAAESEFQLTLGALDPISVEDIRPALQQFGERMLTLIYSPQVQAVRRLVTAEAGRSDLGKRCYELGPARSEAVVAAFLQDAMDEGKLRPADPRRAALHLHGLLEAEWLNRFLFRQVDHLSRKQIADTVRRSIAVFMAAYQPSADAVVAKTAPRRRPGKTAAR